MQREPVPPYPAPNRSLEEFLGAIRFRSQAWCFVHLSERTGFHPTRNDQLRFYAVLDGYIRVTTGVAHVRELNAGDVIFIHPGEIHKVRNREGRTAPLLELPPCDSEATSIPVVQVGNGPAVTRLLCGSLEPIWPDGLYPRAPTILTTRPENYGFARTAIAEIAKGQGCAVVLARLATLLFASAFRDNPRCRAPFRWDLSDPIVRARVLIEKHLFRPWTVASLAKEVGMGQSNFASRFVSRMGQTPIDVLTEERIRHSEIWLLNTDLSIAEIGERAGYRSETAFIRRFSRCYGMTPAQWRRKGRAVSRRSAST